MLGTMAGKSSKVDSRSSAAGQAPAKAILSPLLPAEHEKEMLDIIAATLDQAHTEKHPLCLLALTALLLSLFHDHISFSYIDESFTKDFRLAHPDFISSVLDFLVRQQSLDTIQAMIKTIQICSCDKRRPIIHILHFSPPPLEGVEPWEGPFRNVTVILWRLLWTMTGNLALAKVDRMKERKKTRSKDPGYERFVHYLDTDPESLIRAVSVWFKQTPDSDTVITEFLLRVRSLQPYGIERALGTVPELAQYMQQAMSDHFTTILKSRRIEDAQFAALEGSLLFFQLFIDETAKKSFFGPHACAIYQNALSMISRLEKAGTFPGSDKMQVEILPLLGTLAWNMYMQLPKEIRDRALFPKHIYDAVGGADGSPGPDKTPYAAIWVIMCSYSRGRRCLHLKCGKLPPTSIKSWKQCARCKIVSYCSESCQKAAWTNPEAPHKDLCKDWSKLRTVWPMDDAALRQKPLGQGLLEKNVGLKAKAAPVGFGDSEILKTWENHVKFGFAIHTQLG